MERIRYITDFGVNLQLAADDGTQQELERYGVWAWSARGKYEVIEVGNDLEELKRKHDVPAKRVVKMPMAK